MIPIGGLGGQRQPQQHDARRKHVPRGLQSIRHHRVGMPHQPSRNLDGRQGAADDHPGKRDPLAGLQCLTSAIVPENTPRSTLRIAA